MLFTRRMQNWTFRTLLLKQINKSRVTEQGIKSAIDKVPNPKYLELEERYRKIFKDDDINKRRSPSPSYIDRLFGQSPPPQLPPTPPPSPPPPPPPPFYPGDGGSNFPFDNFPRPPSFDDFRPQSPPQDPDLRRRGREKYFPYTARFPKQDGYSDDDNDNANDGLEYDLYDNNFFRHVQNERITLDENLQDIFPDADRAFEADPQEAGENVKFENFSTTLEK